jgi:hypothetical protein
MGRYLPRSPEEKLSITCLSIFSVLILDSRVEEGRPSCDAAPNGPDTLPVLSISAASMASFSLESKIKALKIDKRSFKLA